MFCFVLPFVGWNCYKYNETIINVIEYVLTNCKSSSYNDVAKWFCT